jgi:hypothetical protein
MEPGDRCICQEDDWHNAFGDKDVCLSRGMRLTVLDLRNIAGVKFYSFEETPKDNFYLYTGFIPLRSLN